MEFFDVLDENGNPTGKTKEKDLVHRDGDWHRGAHLWIATNKKEILLQLRSPQKKLYPNLWDISVAGHVAAGDDARTTLVREAAEEIGLIIQPEEPRHLFRVQNKVTLNNGRYKHFVYADVFLLLKDISRTGLSLQKEELADVYFESFEKFRERVRDRDQTLVPHWEEYNGLLKALNMSL